MRIIRSGFAAIAVLAASLAACARDGSAPQEGAVAVESEAADLILENGRIYTLDPERSWARAVAVRDGKIVYVGDDASSFSGAATKIVDLGGKLVLPAFQDSHAHIAMGGISVFRECPVFDLASKEEVLAAIAECVAANPDAPLIRGVGWRISQFDAGMPPRKELLDAIDSSRPLVFGDADGHALWLNSKAFEQFGITKDMPDPEGGKIQRDPETGELWGTLHEESAMALVSDNMPAYTDQEIEAGILAAQEYFHSLGITSLTEAYVALGGKDQTRSLTAFKALNDSGKLKLRVNGALGWDPGRGLEQVEDFEDARAEFSGGRFQTRSVKFWADGVIETHTAKLLEPYSDQPETSGLMMIPRGQLIAGVQAVDAKGFQAHIHAIGDATVRYALDAIETAEKSNGKRDARHHINHLQVIHPDDIARFAELDVVAGFEPLWAFEDSFIRNFTRPQLGPVRMNWVYPINSVLRTGAHVAFGSDWSVSSPDPLLGIETALTRVDAISHDTPPFLPEQRISLEDALAGYTIEAARSNFLDDMTGSIETGKYADLVILEKNLFEIDPSEISDAKVLVTLLEGEPVYGTLTAD
ncbi:MAG: amidohydrolase [Parvularculaceae bacterium]|nr:amidohydrolase [Parvularculaceae bacterium]